MRDLSALRPRCQASPTEHSISTRYLMSTRYVVGPMETRWVSGTFLKSMDCRHRSSVHRRNSVRNLNGRPAMYRIIFLVLPAAILLSACAHYEDSKVIADRRAQAVEIAQETASFELR